MPSVEAAGHSLSYEWVGSEHTAGPALVFLHEGLGSIRQWRDFPARVTEATGCRALVYDRESERPKSYVPRWPWAPIAFLMRHVPLGLLVKVM